MSLTDHLDEQNEEQDQGSPIFKPGGDRFSVTEWRISGYNRANSSVSQKFSGCQSCHFCSPERNQSPYSAKETRKPARVRNFFQI